MFTFRRACGLLAPIVALGAAAACSPSQGGSHNLDSGGSSGSSGTSGSNATGASGGTGGTISLTGGTGGSVSLGGMGAMTTAGTGSSDTCADMITPGMAVPVDVYVMLDISFSMIDPNPAKWAAVKDALAAFFADASSAGLNVAIQYFPLRAANVPASCTMDSECGTAGPCVLNVCQNYSQGAFVACTPNAADPMDTAPCSNAVQRDDGPCTGGVCQLSGKTCAADTDCQAIQASLGRCVPFGGCEADSTLSCGVISTGGKVAGCGPNGTPGLCVPVAASFCAHEAMCEPTAYKTPAVDYLTLPDTAMTLNGSIAAQMPVGDTPTRPALMGAIAHARERAAAQVGHSQVVVLATDGFPTDCTGGREVSGQEFAPALDDVVAVATEGFTPAKAGDASVSTFVIGVFDDTETTAQSKLDRIAVAGGTTQAFVVSAGGDVQQKFLDALAQIRKARLGCEYQIPPAPDGQKLDYNFVNVKVKHTDGTPDDELFYVAPTGCTGMGDEWHYDCDIKDVNCKPTKIVACPNTCTALESKTNASGVNVGVGCKLNVR